MSKENEQRLYNFPWNYPPLTPEISKNKKKKYRECSNCKVTHSSQWRRGNHGETLCNACRLFEKRKKKKRPKEYNYSNNTSSTIQLDSTERGMEPKQHISVTRNFFVQPVQLPTIVINQGKGINQPFNVQYPNLTRQSITQEIPLRQFTHQRAQNSTYKIGDDFINNNNTNCLNVVIKEESVSDLIASGEKDGIYNSFNRRMNLYKNLFFDDSKEDVTSSNICRFDFNI